MHNYSNFFRTSKKEKSLVQYPHLNGLPFLSSKFSLYHSEKMIIDLVVGKWERGDWYSTDIFNEENNMDHEDFMPKKLCAINILMLLQLYRELVFVNYRGGLSLIWTNKHIWF